MGVGTKPETGVSANTNMAVVTHAGNNVVSEIAVPQIVDRGVIRINHYLPGGDSSIALIVDRNGRTISAAPITLNG